MPSELVFLVPTKHLQNHSPLLWPKTTFLSEVLFRLTVLDLGLSLDPFHI